MKDIFDYAATGYNNQESLQQARLLQKVMFKKHEVKQGRGKKATVKMQFVYNEIEDQEIRIRITNTIKHYENKLETVSEKNNNQRA